MAGDGGVSCDCGVERTNLRLVTPKRDVRIAGRCMNANSALLFFLFCSWVGCGKVEAAVK